MQVPNDVYDSWEFDEWGGRVAAHDACWSQDGDLVKALQLKPTVDQAIELLEHAVSFPRPEIMKELLRSFANSKVNLGDAPLTGIIDQMINSTVLSKHSFELGAGCDAPECLELLLDAGAKWNPTPDQLRSMRLALQKQYSQDVVRVLRLLFYTPGATDPANILELYRTPVIRQKIAEGDKRFVKELEAFQKGAVIQGR